MKPMIDLFSDTKTLPSAAMRQAMANAEVGDEMAMEDPTVNALCARVAQITGKEAAMFTPSGAMCNQIAIAVHCRAGDEIVCDRSAHIVNFEAGGVAANSGANMLVLDGERGIFSTAQLQVALRAKTRQAPRQTLLVVEQTSNGGGGSIWTLPQINDVCDLAKDHGMATHMDGARLFNASIASGVRVADFSKPFDSVWVDFSKGLGAPVGAALAGSKEFINEAWRIKQRLGGAMRQAGIIAAGALYALDNNIARLADDHANAQRLAQGISQLPGIRIDPQSVQSNLVYFDMDKASSGFDAAGFAHALLQLGIRVGAVSETTIRAVTHLDISAADIETVLNAFDTVLNSQ